MAPKIHTATKGKLSEQYVIAKLLENGFNVFLPVVDTEGIDAIIMDEHGKAYPLQIKSREHFTEGDYVRISRFWPDMFVAIYDIATRNFWILLGAEYKTISLKEKPPGEPPRWRIYGSGKYRKALEPYEGEQGLELFRGIIDGTSPKGPTL